MQLSLLTLALTKVFSGFGIGSSLALDFTSGNDTLDPRITFTRALNTATRVNNSGYIETVNANVARFDYDPVTLQSKGLLIEEARTNTARYNQDMSNSLGWLQTNATVTATNVPAPNNTNTGVTFVGNMYTSYGITGVVSTIYTASCFMKAGDSNFGRIRLHSNNASDTIAYYQIDLTTGALTSLATGSSPSAAATYYGNGWWRVAITGTAISTALRMYVYSGTVAAPTLSTTVWGAQLETGAFATSFIPTTTGSVTRNADVATMTSTNFSSWYNQTEGSLYVNSLQTNAVARTINYISITDGTSSNYIIHSTSSSGIGTYPGIVRVAATNQYAVFSSVSFGTEVKSIIGYKQDSIAGAINGSLLSEATTATIPTVDRLYIGANTSGTVTLNGWIKKIYYYPTRLANSALLSLVS